jgi:phosphoribosyl 1,2-cyclic phosphate phosphodiesterase
MTTAQRTFEFLGTGTSVGVPMLGCDCPVCTSTDPKNQRYRCSVLLRVPAGNILIDTGPEVRLQLLRAKVGVVHAVLYTHYHADHLYGLDDMRPIPKHLGGAVPLYCTTEVERHIRRAFGYAFSTDVDAKAGFVPKLAFRTITNEPFTVLGEKVTPIPLEHAHFDVYGFRIGNVAYCTDVSKIPRESWKLLEDLDVLVLDCLRDKPHPGHFCVADVLETIEKVTPKKTYLTHMSHDLDHEATNRRMPAGVELAYDGMRFDF